MKKTLAILLALALVLCMMPSAAFATTPELGTGEVITGLIVEDIPAQTYNGTAIKPALTVKGTVAPTKTVTLSSDEYIAEYTANQDAGTGKVTVKLKSDENITAEKTFTINKLDLGSSSVKISETAPITSVEDAANKVQVMCGNTPITEGFTKTAEISSSDKGTVLVTVTADANATNLTGTTTAAFYLRTAFDSSYSVSAGSLTYTGEALKPALSFKKGTSLISLVEGRDYTVDYSDNVNAGACAITITGIGKYTGTIQGSFSILPKTITNVTATIPNISQNGAIAPVVKDGQKTLVKGVDYTYVEPVTSVPGNKSLVITGIGNYSGTKTVSYTVIDSKNVFDADNVTFGTGAPYYNGSMQYQAVTVKIGNTTLRNGVDYKVEYTSYVNGKAVTNSYAKDAGVYTVTVTGIGSYSGTATGSFRIEQVPLEWAEIVLGSSTVLYDGVYVPKVSVRHISGGFYFPESDYTVTYNYLKYNSAYLRPTVTVTPTGKGNLKAGTVSTLSKEITYSGRSISNCTVNFTDYRSSKNYDGTTTRPSVTVRDYSQNRTLVLNSDYTVTYKDAAGKTVTGLKDAGTYTVVITGIGPYSGTTTLTYTIVGIDISKYTVTLRENSVNADGYGKTPTIVSVKNGVYNTVNSSDYLISYEDSTGKTVLSMATPGTYKVVVTGRNGYTGSTYATYRIVGTPQEIKIAKTAYKVYPTSDSFKISASATGDGTGFSYVSNNPSVATVDAYGNVTVHKIGRAVITVTTTGMKKSDPASDEVYVKVHPLKTTLTQKPWNVSGKSGTIKVRWNKQDEVTKYQIRYSRNSKFTAGTYSTKTVNNSSLPYETQSTSLSKLTKGQRYYIKVRAVKEVYNENGVKITYYGKWSNWRSVVVK